MVATFQIYGHVDPTFLHIYTRTESIAASISPDISKYMPITNKPSRMVISVIYAKCFTCIYERLMFAHVPHRKQVLPKPVLYKVVDTHTDDS